MPPKLVSLWDMVEAYAYLCAQCCIRLIEHEVALQQVKNPHESVSEPWRMVMRRDLKLSETLAREFGMTGLHDESVRITSLLDWPQLPAHRMRDECLGLRRSFQTQLQERHLLYIEPRLVGFYNEPLAQWSGAVAKYPEIETDVTEAGKALALGMGTACVFHLMRVSELALRALGQSLRVRVRDRGRPIPLGEAEWQKILDAIEGKIQASRRRPKSSKNRTKQIAYYAEMKASLEAFKDAWRNHVSHARVHYGSGIAEDIHTNVRVVLRKLAEGAP